MFLGFMIEFAVSMRRIQAFLLCGEINESIVDKSGAGNADNGFGGQETNVSFQIKQGSNFFWGMKKDQKKDAAKGAAANHKAVLDQRG